MNHLYLGIDPGTRCGFALRDKNGRVTSGVWDLQPTRHESAGMRWIKLESCLNQMLPRSLGRTVTLVAYEEVRRHMGVDAAHIYGGIVAHVQRWCEANQIEHTGIPVGTVKKRATGKGNADKAKMVLSANEMWGVQVSDDNEADACWIAETAWDLYAGRAVVTVTTNEGSGT